MLRAMIDEIHPYANEVAHLSASPSRDLAMNGEERVASEEVTLSINALAFLDCRVTHGEENTGGAEPIEERLT